MLSCRVPDPGTCSCGNRKGGNHSLASSLYYRHAVLVLTIITAFIIILTPVNVSAEDIKIYDKDEYEANIPEEAKKYSVNEETSFSDLFNIIKDIALKDIGIKTENLINLIIVCLICSACVSFSKNTDMHDAVSDAANIIFSIYTINIIMKVIEHCTLKSDELSQYTSSLSLGMTSFLVFGGNPSGATVMAASISVLSGVISLLIKNLLPGLCAVLLALSFSTGISGISSVPIKKISNFYILSVTAIMSLLSILITFQFSCAKSAETIAMKGVKLASSYAIPVVGGMIADAAESVAGSFSLLKSSFGLSALIIILSLIIPQIVSILVYKLGFSIIRIMVDFLGGGCASVIDCADSVLNVLLTTVVFSSCVFIFIIYLFLGTPAVI